MIVRDVISADIEALKEMHEKSRFEYEFPDLGNKLFVAAKTVTEDGKPRLAAAAKVTVEIYGWVDADWETPGMRAQALVMLHEAMRLELKRLGLETVHAWLPPSICKSFARRLKKVFGWREASEGPGGDWLGMARDL